MNCLQKLYPPDLTQVLQCIDRHIGIQYKAAVYKVIRHEHMRRCEDAKESSSVKLSAQEKRILITKAIGDVHERLLKGGAFKRSFIATGTELRVDHSADFESKLQGLAFVYQSVCNQAAISAHKAVVQAEEAKRVAENLIKERILEEKKQALKAKFHEAVQIAERVWRKLEPLVNNAAKSYFDEICRKIQVDFICSGSFPAFLIGDELRKLPDYADNVELKFNDIDIYYGNWSEGEIRRGSCTWIDMENIDKEVNLIKCSNLNTTWLVENFDINAVAVCVRVNVENESISSLSWVVAPEF